MIAPDYPPAAAYIEPSVLPYRLSLERVAVAELVADPAAWEIVTRHSPAMKFLMQAPGVDKLLANMTVLDFSVFGAATPPEVVAAVNAELERLPMRGGSK